jgi:hypothetical protein
MRDLSGAFGGFAALSDARGVAVPPSAGRTGTTTQKLISSPSSSSPRSTTSSRLVSLAPSGPSLHPLRDALTSGELGEAPSIKGRQRDVTPVGNHPPLTPGLLGDFKMCGAAPNRCERRSISRSISPGAKYAGSM